MIGDFFTWLLNLNPGTVGLVLFVAVTIGGLGWSFFRGWLHRHDQWVWDDAYHSGLIAGRRQERGELANDIRDPGMEAVTRFYNAMHPEWVTDMRHVNEQSQEGERQ